MVWERTNFKKVFDPGLLNLRSLYIYTVCPKFSVTKYYGKVMALVLAYAKTP